MRSLFLLRRKDNKVALLNSLHWEDLDNFLDRLIRLNAKEVKKKDFEIVLISEHIHEVRNEL